MLSAFDKAAVPILVAALGWLNQKYGLHLNVAPETLTTVIGAISTIVVYFVPNKAA